MNHSKLKAQLYIETITARVARERATQLIVSGRKLRQEGREVQRQGWKLRQDDEKEVAETKSKRLLAKGWDKHRTGMGLIEDFEDSRFYRRCLHLAAAMLNGKTYCQCERYTDLDQTPLMRADDLAEIIKPYLPTRMQVHAEYAAKRWLKDGDMRLKTLYEKDIGILMRLDVKKAEVDRIKDEITSRADELFSKIVNFAPPEVILNYKAIVIEDIEDAEFRATLRAAMQKARVDQATLERLFEKGDAAAAQGSFEGL